MELVDALADAYSDNHIDHNYFLDLKTGNIELDFTDGFTDAPEIDWDDEENEERYIIIPQTDSDQGYRLMTAFANQLEDEDITNRLLLVLSRRSPFRNFKDAVFDLGIRDQWFDFEYTYFKQEVMDWIEYSGLSYKDLNQKYMAYNGFSSEK